MIPIQSEVNTINLVLGNLGILLILGLCSFGAIELVRALIKRWK